MTKPVVVLQNWALHMSEAASPYMAPELIPARLSGKCYGHPSFEDGEDIVTSPVIKRMDDDETYETNNTIYKVGKKHPDYELYLQGYQSEG